MQPIGIFDSGYGGLTIMQEIVKKLPQYDYIYVGDNARSPYGSRSFETVYRYTLEAVKWLFAQDCHLVILACNTASAKALRTIQQNDLPKIAPNKRVLGIIRPVTECIGNFSKTNNIAIFATSGTVSSNSYPIEIEKFFPNVKVEQEACPLWVPLVENGEYDSPGADFFIKKHIDALMSRNNKVDTFVLGCTHYPLLFSKISKYTPEGVKIVSQGNIVAESLSKYLQNHPEMDEKVTKTGKRYFCTTESADIFNRLASDLYGSPIEGKQISLEKPEKLKYFI
ncbi:MAG TPA: glutamate racemase [Bacteroidales bacterium]|nr:glutamate racemase [Bacteroidales bacterium]